MNYHYLIAFFIIFLLREISVLKKNITLKYILTPLITLTVIIIAINSVLIHGHTEYGYYIIIGLLFSLIADVLLMIEKIDLFIYGLLFFLMAHLNYVYALNIESIHKFNTASFFIYTLPLTAGIAVYYFINKKNSKYSFPVLIYIIALTALLSSSLNILFNNNYEKGLILTIASILFIISDSILAFNKFIKPVKYSTFFTWLLYAPSQLLFALSILK